VAAGTGKMWRKRSGEGRENVSEAARREKKKKEGDRRRGQPKQ